jgi:predicted Zn-dependent protease
LKARVSVLAGHTGEALAALDEAAPLAAEGSWDSVTLKIQRADVLVLVGDAVAAETILRRALAEAPLAQGRMLELRAATRLVRLEHATGRREAAVVLRQILETFTEGFGTVDLVEARSALDAAGLAPEGLRAPRSTPGQPAAP